VAAPISTLEVGWEFAGKSAVIVAARPKKSQNLFSFWSKHLRKSTCDRFGDPEIVVAE
jgi:hypothetical protein